MTGAAIAGLLLIGLNVGFLAGCWWRGRAAERRREEDATLAALDYRDRLSRPEVHIVGRYSARLKDEYTVVLEPPYDWQDDPNLADPHAREDGHDVRTGW